MRLGCIAVAACAILAFLRPRGALGAAPIVMVRDSGALYVRIGDAMHPVYNLASARLIAGSPREPELVSASAVDTARRGPLVGIAGAPDTIADRLSAMNPTGPYAKTEPRATTVIVGKRGAAGFATQMLWLPRAGRARRRHTCSTTGEEPGWTCVITPSSVR